MQVTCLCYANDVQILEDSWQAVGLDGSRDLEAAQLDILADDGMQARVVEFNDGLATHLTLESDGDISELLKVFAYLHLFIGAEEDFLQLLILWPHITKLIGPLVATSVGGPLWNIAKFADFLLVSPIGEPWVLGIKSNPMLRLDFGFRHGGCRLEGDL